MSPNTSKLIHFDYIGDVETLQTQIENHLEVFGHTSISYQKCLDLKIEPESLVNEKRQITHGTLCFTLTPRNTKRTFNTGESLARLSRAELKEAIKEAKTATKTKQRIRN